MVEFIYLEHWRPAIWALLLFLCGGFLSVPVARLRVRWLVEPPLAVFRFITRAIGPSPGLARMAAVIFAWNATAIFLYMASGWHPLLPMAFSLLTGLNIGIIVLLAPRQGETGRAPFGVEEGHWVPPTALGFLCGLAVPVLELSTFWFAIGMGIRMGRLVQSGRAGYLQALAPRARAYAAVLVPVLLVSAVAESVAIRAGSARATGRRGGQG